MIFEVRDNLYSVVLVYYFITDCFSLHKMGKTIKTINIHDSCRIILVVIQALNIINSVPRAFLVAKAPSDNLYVNPQMRTVHR